MSQRAKLSANLVFLPAIVCILTLTLAACSNAPDPRRTNFEVKGKDGVARYDPDTGRLKRIDADMNKNGRIETFGYWDANLLIRIEIDRDEDGTVDRWEHYDEKKQLTRVGTSSRDDGIEDTWSYPDATGFLAKVESDTDRDSRVDRRELYVPQPDTAGGRVLAAVELEFDHTGRPQRRLTYKPDGNFDKAEDLR